MLSIDNILVRFHWFAQGVRGILNTLKDKRAETGLTGDQMTFLQAAQYAYEVHTCVVCITLASSIVNWLVVELCIHCM